MNRHEAARVLAYLNAAWPNTKLPEATARLWLDELDRVEVDIANTVAPLLARKSQWFPTLAEFLAGCATEKERRAPTVTAIGAAPPDESTQARIAALIAEARAQVAERKGEHNHHGPAPCPVCGGINPDYSRKGQSAMRGETG